MKDERDHEQFLRSLDASDEAVWYVARWLSRKYGKNVRIPTSGRAPTRKDNQNYVDRGDLEIGERVEVKELSASFTCREDWPYAPHFIVCAKHAWDRASPKPHRFIYLNESWSHVAVVKGSSFRHWTTATRNDRRYHDNQQEFYFCPMEYVVFMKMKEGE